MNMLAVMLLVGAGSYALRVVPLLFVDRLRLSRRAEEMLGDAAIATMTALVVALVLHLDDRPGVSPAARWTGLAVGALAAMVGLSVARVAALGLAAAGAVTLLAQV